HGPVPEAGNDWNLHRSDARNLVAFASAELFKKQPLAWQVFDTRRAGGDLTRQRVEEVTAGLLQSPVAYFSGTKAPRFPDGEEAVLREYVEQGGFLYAEAACGSQAFDQGFRGLVKRLFPDPGTPLKLLPPDHPVYTASGKFAVSPKDYPLWGIEMGCKTVVIYSPQGLSCYWEHNHSDKGKGREAFRLGANIIAYATGLEPPRPRLTKMEVVKTDDEKKVPRGFLKVAQVRHEGKRQAAQAVANLMTEMRKAGL